MCVCVFHTYINKIFKKVLSSTIREQKEIIGIQIGKVEVQLTLFADDMILYLENPKDSTPRLLELIQHPGGVMGGEERPAFGGTELPLCTMSNFDMSVLRPLNIPDTTELNP